MVVPVPGEPLLLYIAATSEAMSKVLVTERPGPRGLHELGGPFVDGSGSSDSGPAEELGANAAAGSQSSEATTAPLTRVSRGPQVQSSH
jgi:hypothetical protein